MQQCSRTERKWLDFSVKQNHKQTDVGYGQERKEQKTDTESSSQAPENLKSWRTDGHTKHSLEKYQTNIK